MSLFNISLTCRAALVFAILCAASFPHAASCAEFLKPGIEKSVRRALPDFEVSIGEVSAFHKKGLQIKDLYVSKDGQKIARAKSVFVSYGSVISSMLFEDFLSSSAIEIEGLEVFLSSEVRRLFSNLRAPDSASNPESENTFGSGGFPEIIIRDSVFHFQDRNAIVHSAALSFVGGEPQGGARVRLENAYLSFPHLNLSLRGLALGADVTRTEKGLKISGADGNLSLETLRGEPVAEAEFGVSIPDDGSNTVWNGSVSLSGITLQDRRGGFSFNSVAFDKNGVLSIYGRMFAGGFTSFIKAQINTTAGGGIFPDFGRKSVFEIKADVAKDELSIGEVKFTGDIRKQDEMSVISAKIADGYRNKLDMFGVGELLENFNFKVALKGGGVASGEMLVKSPKFFMEADLKTSGRGSFEIDYRVESDDVFHLSEAVSFLSPYSVSGGFRSSGKIERSAGGRIFLSGEAKIEDFAATFGKQLHIGGGKINFMVPLEGFAFEKVVFQSSIKNVSYAETSVKKANLDFGEGDIYAKIEFENSDSFEFAAFAGRKNGKIRAEIENIKINSGGSGMWLSTGFSVELSDEEIEVAEMLLHGRDSYLRFSGSYKNTGEPEISVNADLGDVDTSLFELFYPPLRAHRGLLSGKISMEGSAGLPVADVRVKYKSVPSGTRAELYVARSRLSKPFLLKLTIEEDDSTGAFFRGSGTFLPTGTEIYKIRELLSGSSEYDFTLSAKSFSLKPIGILSEKIRDLDGIFSGDLAVFNGGGDFSIKGDIDIETAKVKVGDWTELMEIRSARMDFEENKMRASFNLADSYGGAKGAGSFNFGDFSYNCEVNLSGIYLHIKYLYSGFYGTVFIDGKGKNIRLRGRGLKTKNANVWLEKDYNIAVHDLVFVDRLGSGFSEGKKPGFFSRTADLDFRLLISKDTKFRLDRVDALLSGELHVLKVPGEDFTSVDGKLNVFRGSYRVLGKRFAVDEGAISFSTREHLSPVVNINAFYERTGLLVKAFLHGEANDLKLQLSSAPVMNEDKIIIALLGAPADGSDHSRASDIIEEVRDGRPGGGLAFGYAADELFSSVVEGGNLFNFVDVLSIKSEGAGAFDSEIEVGAYVTDKLYFTYERINEALPISASYKSRFTALYRLSNHFTLEGVAGGLTHGANLLFNVDFR